MLPRNLQIQYTADPRKTEFIPPNRLYCIRQSNTTLEFLYARPQGDLKVIVVNGSNLGLLRRSILAGAVFVLTPQKYDPLFANVEIHSITQASLWTIPKETMAPDPNFAPKHMLQFETGLVRDLWSHAFLDAFAIPSGKDEKFLFQFRGDYSYIITPSPTAFLNILKELKATNLDPGMVNKFSSIQADLPNLPGVDGTGYLVSQISVNRRNYAAESAWDIMMDFRTQSIRPKIAMDI